MARQRKGLPRGCVVGLAGFFVVFALVFGGLGYVFVSGIINENTNPHEITVVVQDKEIVTAHDRLPDFVITATVFDEDGGEHDELFVIRGSGARNIYAQLRVGEHYTLTVNGDPDKYRVITGIVEEP